MENELFKLATGNGVWAALYVFLFLFTIYDSKHREKKSEEREEKYQDIIKELSRKFEVVEIIHKDVNSIKDKLERI